MLGRFWEWRWRGALLSVAFWVVFAGVLRVTVATVATPEGCGTVDAASLRDSVLAARDWIVRNQKQDGGYTYLHSIGRSVSMTDYNTTRHAGVTLALYEVQNHFPDDTSMQAADLGLSWMLQRVVVEDNWSAITDDGNRLGLGANALMVAALAERRIGTGDKEYDELMRRIGRFMVGLQRPDGGFHIAYVLDQDAPDSEGTSLYYPGEALWALTLLADALPDEGWDAAARNAATYISTIRDDLEDTPDLPDHWAAYGFAEMADWGLTEDESDYARKLVDRFGQSMNLEARAASLGTKVEGLAAIWRLAQTDDRLADLRPEIKQRMTCAASVLRSHQTTAQDAAQLPNPGLIEGAWFTDAVTRMDDQQHALSGLLYTLDALSGSTERGPASNSAP